MNDTDRQQIDRLLDGDLSPEEWDALRGRLEADPGAIAYLADRAILVSDLRRSLTRRKLQRDVMASVLTGSHTPSQHGGASPFWRRWLTVVGAVAAILLLALGGFLFLHRRWTDRGEVIAEIIESQEVLPAHRWQAGQRVALREITLASGRVTLRLPRGILLDLRGPLDAEFASATTLKLFRGKATADVGETGKGFVIETVNARVVDLGTRFGVAVGKSNATDIVVFDGKVEVFEPAKNTAAQRPPITLTEGEAIRVDGSRKPQRARMIVLGTDARSLQDGTSADVVADVKDNVSERDFHRYYGLLRGAMGDGARAYTTGHTRTWHAMPGETFPEELVGADVVCTFYPARREKDLEITVLVTRPCVLYVFPDARQPVPDWLRRDFTDTGLRLRSGPWLPRGVDLDSLPPGEAGKTYVPFQVWKRTIAKPGPVLLGTPCASGHDDRQAMYGLAVKALP
jgi:hypothetical protein